MRTWNKKIVLLTLKTLREDPAADGGALVLPKIDIQVPPEEAAFVCIGRISNKKMTSKLKSRSIKRL